MASGTRDDERSDSTLSSRGASAGLVRLLTLVVSGVPTLLAWTLLAHETGAAVFAGVALAQSLPTLVSFSVRSLGAGIVLAFPHGTAAVHQQIRRTFAVAGLVSLGLVVVAVVADLVGLWTALFGDKFGSFDLDRAVLLSGVMVAAWIPTIVFERVLVGQGRVTTAILAASVSGPTTLVVLTIFTLVSDPAWWWVAAFLSGNLLGGLLQAYLARSHLAAFRPAPSGREPAVWQPRRGTSAAFFLAETAGMVTLWLARPILAIRGSVEEVALFAFSFQVIQPILSIVTAVASAWWARYAASPSLSRRRVGVDSLRLGLVAAALALAGLVAWFLAHAVSLTPYEPGPALAAGWTLTAFAIGSLRPARLAQSVRQQVVAMVVASTAGLVLGAALLFALSGPWGGDGTTWALFASFALTTALAYSLWGGRAEET